MKRIVTIFFMSLAIIYASPSTDSNEALKVEATYAVLTRILEETNVTKTIFIVEDQLLQDLNRRLQDQRPKRLTTLEKASLHSRLPSQKSTDVAVRYHKITHGDTWISGTDAKIMVRSYVGPESAIWWRVHLSFQNLKWELRSISIVAKS